MKELITFQSANKESTVHGVIWLPENVDNAVGLLQISHGMCEHIERYERFANYLTKKGWIVFGNDHVGHGNSVNSDDDYGFFSNENGHAVVVRDLRRFAKIVLPQYPTLPYIIFGHSMGSFIARIYTSVYKEELSGAIYMGTGGGSLLYKATAKLAEMEIKKHGLKAKGSMFEKLMVGAFIKKIDNRRTDCDWLSRDETEVDKFINDPKCGHTFTNSAYLDLFKLISISNDKATIKKIPETLPILLISGDMDPVGDFGKGVLSVANTFLKTGHSNLTIKMYPEARHELLNEINKDEVHDYLFNYLCQFDRSFHLPKNDFE